MSRSSHHGLAGLLALLSGALGCELPSPILEETRASLIAETDAVHLLGVDRAGRLRHTIRYPNGAWDPLGDVASQAGEIGSITDVGSAYSNDILFVAARTGVVPDFRWWLTQRFDNGSWAPFAALSTPALVVDLGMDRTTDGKVHLCGQSQRLSHGIWNFFSGFGGFNELPIPLPAGIIRGVDCAAVGGDLHYLVVHELPVTAEHQLSIAVRRADGTWSPFQKTHSLHRNQGLVINVTLDSSGDTLHMQASTLTGTQFHAMKAGGGAWSELANVEAVAGDPRFPTEPYIDSGATAVVGGNLHLLQATRGDSSGRVWHTIRFPSGGWAAFGNVSSAVPGGLPSGGLLEVSLSRSRNN